MFPKLIACWDTRQASVLGVSDFFKGSINFKGQQGLRFKGGGCRGWGFMAWQGVMHASGVEQFSKTFGAKGLGFYLGLSGQGLQFGILYGHQRLS